MKNNKSLTKKMNYIKYTSKIIPLYGINININN